MLGCRIVTFKHPINPCAFVCISSFPQRDMPLTIS
jgi:hypothetical protein